MRPTALLVLFAALALGAFGGCGGDPEAEAREAVEGYIGALRAADPAEVCSLLTQAELDDLEVAGSCREVFSSGFELLEQKRVEIPNYEVGQVVVNGERAEATLASGGAEEVVPLAKDGGEWKVAGTTSLDQIHPDDPLSAGSARDEIEE